MCTIFSLKYSEIYYGKNMNILIPEIIAVVILKFEQTDVVSQQSKMCHKESDTQDGKQCRPRSDCSCLPGPVCQKTFDHYSIHTKYFFFILSVSLFSFSKAWSLLVMRSLVCDWAWASCRNSVWREFIWPINVEIISACKSGINYMKIDQILFLLKCLVSPSYETTCVWLDLGK